MLKVPNALKKVCDRVCSRAGKIRRESGSTVWRGSCGTRRIRARHCGAGDRRRGSRTAVRHVRHRRRHGDRARAGMARTDATQCGGDVNACDRTDLDFRRHVLRDLRKHGLARRAAAVLRHVCGRADWQLAALALDGTRIAMDFRSVPRVCGGEPDKFCAVARPAHCDECVDRSLPWGCWVW